MLIRDKQISSLHFAVRPRILMKFLGQLLFVIGALSVVPLLFALLAGEYFLVKPYLIILAATAGPGYLLQKVTVDADIQRNEAFIITALIFVIASALGTLPFHYAGLQWEDAFFEAVSGVTTTGLSMVPAVSALPETFLFGRAWLQWTGGLGIVILSIAIILPHSQVTLKLFEENWERGGIVASTKFYARFILKIYLSLTVAGFLVLLISGVDWFDAVTHVLAAVSTGGFSSFDKSLGGLDTRLAQGIVTLLSFLGAIPFITYYLIPRLEWRKFIDSEELRTFVAMVLFSSAVITACFVLIDGRQVVDAVMLAVSAQTTAGFSTVPVPELSTASKFLLLPIMFVGGNVGSTAGGIKILHLLIMLKMIRLLIIRSGMPSDAVIHPRLEKSRLAQSEIEHGFILIMLFIIVICLSWFCFVVFGYPVLDSLFEVVSATCTVGLSSGISSPDLPLLLKSVLCIDMLLGRLEIIAFLVLLYPPTWFGKKRGV